MNALLFALLLVLILPLVMTGWRSMLAALSLQGLLMGCMVFQRAPLSWEAALPLFDLLLVRGVVVPLLLYGVMRERATSRRGDARPPNMLSLMLVAVLVAVAFRFAERLDPGGAESQLRLAVSASGVLFGLFLLATQVGVFTQVAGALYIENAIALFELDRAAGVLPIPVEMALLAVFVASAGVYVRYVNRLSTFVAALPDDSDEAAAL